jgi:KDO2-lipid IV(A) lauroyltransferase
MKHEGVFPFFMEGLLRWVTPGWRCRALVSLVFRMLWVSKIRKKVAMRNMERAFPEASEKFKEEILEKHYRHLALSLGEYLVLLKNSTKIEDYMKPEEEKRNFLDNLRDRREGAVIFTAHMGNWELLAAWLAHRGYPMHAIVRRHEKKGTEAFVESARARVGLHTISKSDNMLKVLRLLKKGAFVGILGDQYAGHEGISLPFFGYETSCYFGAAALALMAGVPLVPVVSWRDAPFSHCVRVCTPLFIPSREKKSDTKELSREERIAALTEASNRVLEEWIREHPEQWLWLHRRYR